MKYRKKPVVIEALQFHGSNFGPMFEFCPKAEWFIGGDAMPHLKIETLEGDHRASVGDWIIKGIKGEFYPCKPDIFELTYEPVGE